MSGIYLLNPVPMSLSWWATGRLRTRVIVTGYNGGADLVESTERLRILLVRDDQGPLFKREVGQTRHPNEPQARWHYCQGRELALDLKLEKSKRRRGRGADDVGGARERVVGQNAVSPADMPRSGWSPLSRIHSKLVQKARYHSHESLSSPSRR